MGRFAFFVSNGERVSVRSVAGSETLEAAIGTRHLGMFIPSQSRWTHPVDQWGMNVDQVGLLKEVEAGLALVDKQRRDEVRKLSGADIGSSSERDKPSDSGRHDLI